MSQSSGSPPPDEPIIGGPPVAPSPPPLPAQNGQGANPYGPPEAYVEDDTYAGDEYGEEWDDDEYDEEADDRYGFYDEYDEGPPARQPIFYAFVALAAIVGAVVVFFLFMIVRDNGGGTAKPTASAEFSVLIDSPQDKARVEVDKEQTFDVRAKSNQSLETIALMVDGKQAASDDVSTQPKPDDGIYHASLKTTFTDKREYRVAIHVTTISGAQHDSKPITIVAYEPVSATPPTATGTVVATVGARTGPGDAFDVVATLNAGDPVTIVGKTADGQWLVVQGENNQQQWVRAAAVKADGSLNNVPVVEGPAAPSATPTNTPAPKETPTPTQAPATPDFIPGNASLTDNGNTLQVTVANIGDADYEGPLVIAIDGVVGAQTRVFNVNIRANGGTALNFSLNAPVTSGGQVAVSVDADGIVPESREDNNSTGFTVQAPVVEPTETPEPQSPTATGTESTTGDGAGGG